MLIAESGRVHLHGVVTRDVVLYLFRSIKAQHIHTVNKKIKNNGRKGLG